MNRKSNRITTLTGAKIGIFMIIVDDVVLSDDIADNFFVCDLIKCKGACCVEGDLGAPLTNKEASRLVELMDDLKPYLSPKGIKIIEEQGAYVRDYENDLSTPTIDGRECAYAVYDDQHILKCGIEHAWQKGAADFQKPISCHLYPIRITRYDRYEAINYDRWHICNPACANGESLKVPLYKFLKEPLIRRYGEEWYRKLVDTIHQIS